MNKSKSPDKWANIFCQKCEVISKAYLQFCAFLCKYYSKMPLTFTAPFNNTMQLLQEILSIEQALIGYVIYHPESFLQLSVEIQPALFQEPFHQVIIQTMFEIDQSGSALDVHILKQNCAIRHVLRLKLAISTNCLTNYWMMNAKKCMYIF